MSAPLQRALAPRRGGGPGPALLAALLLLGCPSPAPTSAPLDERASEAPPPGREGGEPAPPFVEREPRPGEAPAHLWPRDPQTCAQCPPGGCPGYDCDDDRIPDEEDACPSVPEDLDGFEDADGCPDPDNDRDGVPDVEDRCPSDPEDLDGVDDEDGCHDDAGVPLTDARPR